MENFKNNFLKTNKFIILIIFCVLITSLVIVFAYEYTGPRGDLHKLNSIVNKINHANSLLDKCNDDLTIDTKVTIDTLTTNVKTLDQIKNDISATKIKSSTVQAIVPKVISSINSTQNLYNSCINTLTSSNKSSLADTVSTIDNLHDICIKEYDELNTLGINIKFTKSNMTFFENLTTYLTTLDKINKQQEIKTSQKQSFTKSLSTTISDFSAILEDLEPAITKIREDGRSIDVLIDDIYTKESNFNTIRKNLNYISIPEGFIDYYNSMNEIFTTYSTYLTTMKTALIYEKSSSSYEQNKDNIDKNYNNAYSKYNDVKAALDTLTKSLENL